MAKLQPGSPDYIYLRIIGMRLQVEEVLEKIEVGLNPQESFTQMSKDRDVKNRIRGQVMHLEPQWGRRPWKKSETGNRGPEDMRKKNNRFISFLMGKRFPHRSTPMDHAAGLKKILSHQI